jgi:PiT family inorganic phosphate transporter
MLQHAFAELSSFHLLFFIVAVVGVCAFEFVNGFHDTANAVATVIYTRTLRPVPAVIWSAIWNFLGVWVGGIAVAISILNLLPVSEMMYMPEADNLAIVFAVLVTAIAWNLITWYFGIPCSSSHTLIGSILGAGIGFFWTHGGQGINWDKALDIGLSLLFSPAFGFTAVIMVLYIFRYVVKNKDIFKDPSENENKPPPWWIRAILLTTCTMVSFFHGNNDGQKGVGILLIVLLAMLPASYALNPALKKDKVLDSIEIMKTSVKEYEHNSSSNAYSYTLDMLDDLACDIEYLDWADKESKLDTRKRIQVFTKSAKAMLEDPAFITDGKQRRQFKHGLAELKSVTDYKPFEVVLLIALSLGLGTMVGWKRIVITIGEKIGKTHLTYAQGAAAELVAAGTIGMSSGLGLPVSTTHVLSSAVAGSMVGVGGMKNLQRTTVTTIAMTWLFTLPVTFIGALLLYNLFLWIF